MIAVKGLRHVYDGATVLDLASWDVADGAPWLVLGASGSGKTTLLHILAGLLTPTGGTVSVAGQDLAGLSAAARDRFRGRHIGIVFQQLHLIDALTVRQNLALARRLAGLDDDAAAVTAVLDDLGLADRAGAYPHQLSHGQAQRVALARALVNTPSVVLADEPTANLDDANAARVADLLVAQAAAHGATLVIATHDSRLQDRFDNRITLDGP